MNLHREPLAFYRRRHLCDESAMPSLLLFDPRRNDGETHQNAAAFLAVTVTLITARILPDFPLHPEADHPYFSIVLIAVGLLTGPLFLILIRYFLPAFQERYSGKVPFYTGVRCSLCALNILTVKAAILPVLYFPSLDRVFDCARCLISHYSADQQRHRQHPEFLF